MTKSSTNDDSNPQQGSGKPQQPATSTATSTGINFERHVFKIPPTKRDERKIFVGGLPANITENEFRDFFQQYGELIDSVVMFDRETRRSRGFGFVTFEDPEVCRKLLTSGGGDGTTGRLEMQGKICEVKSAQPKEKSNRPPPRGGRGGVMPGVVDPAVFQGPPPPGALGPMPPPYMMYPPFPPAHHPMNVAPHHYHHHGMPPPMYYPPPPYHHMPPYIPPPMEYPMVPPGAAGMMPPVPPPPHDAVAAAAAANPDYSGAGVVPAYPVVDGQAPHHLDNVPYGFVPPMGGAPPPPMPQQSVMQHAPPGNNKA